MGASNLFSTPVFTHDLLGFSEQNEKIHKFALALREKDPGVSHSNAGGAWHSTETPDYKIQELTELGKALNEAVKVVVDGLGFQGLRLSLTGMWFVITPTGASNVRHCHPRAFLSGVYYVKAPPGSSHIVFHDPRQAKTYSTPTVGQKVTPYTADKALIEVKDQRLVLFPGWLEHSVPENKSEGERVVLSFNYALT